MQDSNSIVEDVTSTPVVPAAATTANVAAIATPTTPASDISIRKSVRKILEYALTATGLRPNAVEVSYIQQLIVEFVESGAIPQEILDADIRAANEKVTLANPVIAPPMSGQTAQKLDDIRKILNQ